MPTKPSLVVIECTFPCSNSNDLCEVSTNFVKCKARTNKTKWVLKSASSVPEYQGTPIELGQPCITAPLPHLKDASHLSMNASETTMHWPPYDAFYSNCGRNLYCNSDHNCEYQLPIGSTCQSDNHCLNNGQCRNQVCRNNNTPVPHSGYNTIHIILTVLGFVLALAVLFGAYFIKRRRRQKKQLLLQQQEKPVVVDHSNTSFSSSTHHSSTVTNMLDYDTPLPPPPPLPTQPPLQEPPTSSSSHRHTPSMQQRQLQYQLQRQLVLDKKSVEINSIQPPPPPYSP